MTEARTARDAMMHTLEAMIGRLRGEFARLRVAQRWRRRSRWRAGRPHGLPGRLIISLTTHRPRLRTLHLSLRCLLDQTVAPDGVILWLSEETMRLLPPDILALRESGLTISARPEIGSYGKIIPALEADPATFIVTADDDAYYHTTWLEELVSAVRPGELEVICHRAHRIEMGDDGLPLAYVRWTLDLNAPEVSRRVFPTGVGGTLFPPGIFHPDVLDRSLYRNLCPTADDLWLFWMALRNGARFRKIGRRRLNPLWPGSQRVNLYQINVLNGGNDRQMAKLIERFGFPAL